MKMFAYTAAILFAIGLCTTAVQATAILGFNQHTDIGTIYPGSGSGQTALVDQYSGTTGGGWATAWQVRTNGSSLRETVVRNTNTLDGNGNYVSHSWQPFDIFTSQSSRRAGLQRVFDNAVIAYDQPHEISFLYRVDDLTPLGQGGASYLQMLDGGPSGSEPAGNTITWWMRTLGGTTSRNFFFVDNDSLDGNFNAANFVNTGMALNEGDVYRFLISVNPAARNYNVFIRNLDTNQVYNSPEAFSFNSDINSNGRTYWGGQIASLVGSEGPEFTISLDQVDVNVPEPASAGLLGLAALIGLRRRRA